jgi:energy-coupling factor transporter ATP-binding protein EcfA2
VKLRRLVIRRLPGVAPGFALEPVAPGLSVVVGPNASGKSSLIRALHALLDPAVLPGAALDLEAEFDTAAGRLELQRFGSTQRWLRDGRPVEPPPLPDARFFDCYALRLEDLLAVDAPAEAQIGERLARELAGGYDLGALLEQPPWRLKQTHGRAEQQQLADAQRELDRVRREHRALQRQEDELAALQRERDDAAGAQRDIEAIERALEALEARRRQAAVADRLSAYPTGMERLRGDELERLDEARTERAQSAVEREQAEGERVAAEAALADSGLSADAVDEAALDDRRRLAQRLLRLEGELERAQNARDTAAAAQAAARRALGGDAERPPRLEPDSLHRVEQRLGALRDAEADLRQLELAVAGLPVPEQAAAGGEAVAAARHALLDWLAAGRDDGRRRRWAGVLALAAGGAAAAAAGLGLHWAWWSLLLPLAVAAAISLAPAAARNRADARSRLAASGCAGPTEWRPPAVSERLAELDVELQRIRRLERDLERRAELERRRDHAAEALATQRAALAELAEQVGFDPQRLDASLQRWVHLAAEHDRAATALAQHEQTVTDLQRAVDQQRAALIGWMAEHGAAAEAGVAADAEMLAARLDRLAARLRQRDRARQRLDEAERRIAQAAAAERRAAERSAAVFEAAGLDPVDESAAEAELRRRCRQLDAWREQREALQQARLRAAERSRAVEDRPQLLTLVEAGDAAALRAALDAGRQRAARLDELNERIPRIRAAIEQASRDRAQERARAAVADAAGTLAERLDQALSAEAGRMLIEDVRAEHVEVSRPQALRRAAEWFRRFSRHGYELLFEPEAEARFGARETTSGARRRLDELSSGTRVQLLLAVRVAFALEAERGREALPLVLDEALTTADPQRFQAVVDALHTLADEGQRQVLYLTAQPADLSLIEAGGGPVQRIDLLALRRMGCAIDDAERLELPPAALPPEPTAHTPAQYAVALGVDPLDPWSAPESIHAFHLLRDELDLLYRLLRAGVERLGAVESLLADEAAPLLLDAAEQRLLRRRLAGARVWLEAWRCGRGRPVDRSALESSDAVSAVFIDRTAALAAELGGDAAALIERLAAGAVERFRNDKREELRVWLAERGFIDARPRLDAAAVQQRVLLALAGPAAQAGTEAGLLEEARGLCAGLEAGLRAGRPEG